MARKSPTKSPTPPGALVVPPHGNGKLRHGSRRGTNGGGTGRPPSAIRERLRGSFEERIEVLEEIADDPMQTPADRTRAIDLLAKYGLGTTKEITVEHVRDKLQDTIALIREQLPRDQAEPLLERMRTIWR